MSDPKTEHIKQGIKRALEEVARRFEEDPTPTDGTFRAAQEKMRPKAKGQERKSGVAERKRK